MSLRPEPIEPVPEETARVARAAFPRGNPCLPLRDVLGSIYTDEDFVDLFPRRGQQRGKTPRHPTCPAAKLDGAPTGAPHSSAVTTTEPYIPLPGAPCGMQ
jgi:hypothetical protein